MVWWDATKPVSERQCKASCPTTRVVILLVVVLASHAARRKIATVDVALELPEVFYESLDYSIGVPFLTPVNNPEADHYPET